jgi:TolB-like protein
VLASGTAYRLISASRSPVRIAVVAFGNHTDLHDLDAFSEHLNDIVIDALTENRSLAVVYKAAILRPASSGPDLARIRRALGAEYIITGEIQPSNEGLRVSTLLIRANDQTVVWSKATPIAKRSQDDIEHMIARDLATAVGAQAAKR